MTPSQVEYQQDCPSMEMDNLARYFGTFSESSLIVQILSDCPRTIPNTFRLAKDNPAAFVKGTHIVQ